MENMDELKTQTKKMLDDMHKRKIDMADVVYVINVGGYIGESTYSEIEYAKLQKKPVYYLEGFGLNKEAGKNKFYFLLLLMYYFNEFY